jgi:hypothetical protein
VNAIALVEHLLETGSSVILAVLPLAALFLLFQVLFLQLPLGEVKRILVSTCRTPDHVVSDVHDLGLGFGILACRERVGGSPSRPSPCAANRVLGSFGVRGLVERQAGRLVAALQETLERLHCASPAASGW